MPLFEVVPTTICCPVPGCVMIARSPRATIDGFDSLHGKGPAAEGRMRTRKKSTKSTIVLEGPRYQGVITQVEILYITRQDKNPPYIYKTRVGTETL